MISRTRPFRRILLAFTLAIAALPFAIAAQQQPAKRALNHGDYDSWRSVQLQQLSADGKILAYAVVPQDGDGEVVVRNLSTGREFRHTRGHRPETANPAESGSEETSLPRSPMQISAAPPAAHVALVLGVAASLR